MNIDDISIRVKRQFGDESGVQVTDQDIFRWINDAQHEACVQIPFIHMASSQIATVTGQQAYTLPTNLADIHNIKFRASGMNVFYDLRGLPTVALDELVDGWEGTTDNTGDPAYYCRGKVDGTFRVFPVPDNAQGLFDVQYGRYCTDIVTSADPIDLPGWLHPYVLEYCLMKAYEMDEEWEAADRKAAYLQSTLDANANRATEVQGDTYPTIVTTSEDYA